jgi:ribosomal protein S12 methylthiotransferase
MRRLLARIRAAVPGIALRSAFIVGFPGETEDDVAELCDFLEETGLDHVGVFTYSQEENTAAGELPGQVSASLKEERRARVMAVQARVAAARAAGRVGDLAEVLVERVDGRGRLVGRAAWQAPEIDGVVRLRGEAAPGNFVRARITGAATYDLHARVVENGVDTHCPET